MAYTYQLGANQMNPSNWFPQWSGAGNTTGGKVGNSDTVFEQFENSNGKIFNHTCAESNAEQTLSNAEYKAVSELVQSGAVNSVDEAIQKVTGKTAKQIETDYFSNPKENIRSLGGYIPDWA